MGLLPSHPPGRGTFSCRRPRALQAGMCVDLTPGTPRGMCVDLTPGTPRHRCTPFQSVSLRGPSTGGSCGGHGEKAEGAADSEPPSTPMRTTLGGNPVACSIPKRPSRLGFVRGKLELGSVGLRGWPFTEARPTHTVAFPWPVQAGHRLHHRDLHPKIAPSATAPSM